MLIKPFKAYRFNPDVVKNNGDCISPPYDVISEKLQSHLYAKSDYNIVRVIKGKTNDSDSESDNQYTRAAEFLNDWIGQNALKQDDKEMIYSYIQDFQLGNQNVQRSSFIATAKLEDLGTGVKPHENTLDGPKADRLKLQLACQAKFGLIFMLYKDQQMVADNINQKKLEDNPLVDFIDEQGVRHRLFGISDQNDMDAIGEMMKDKTCIIADGHHRYETALNFYKQTKNPAAQFQMMAFANTCNQGLLVLATHRLVYGINNFSGEKLLADLSEDFTITDFTFNNDSDKAQAKQKMLSAMKSDFDNDKNCFGVYCSKGKFSTVSLKNKDAMESIAADKTPDWRKLNVAVLHKLLLEKQLGIDDKALAAKTNLEYVKDTPDAIDECIEKVDNGISQAAFFISPEKMDQIAAVSETGEKMPQKSTYFYPKVYTGLTVQKI
ncbi:MAG: DUF1015 domain-containing protein [Phycisphaerae bacterium]|nr:DUF1015 domain-containing protein [Phycisphaerae bacterium]